MSRVHRKFHVGGDYGKKINLQSLQNLSQLPYNKPITFTPKHVHRHHKKIVISQIPSFENLEQTQPKGLILELIPQKREFYYMKQLSLLTWFIAQTLFWLHVVNIFPNGSGMQLSQPPKYKSPLPKPQNKDYIIEPDWDSIDWNSSYD